MVLCVHSTFPGEACGGVLMPVLLELGIRSRLDVGDIFRAVLESGL